MFKLQIPTAPLALPDSIPTVREEVSMLKSMPVDELVQRLISSMVTFAINLAVAIIVFYVGRLIINKIYRVVRNIFIKRAIDRSLATFVLSMVRMVLYFILVVTVISILGIETSSFIALFASAGVAIGMALSGTLQNFAGGVLILLLKPYKIGDYIEAQGYAGTVCEIQIFHTIICTVDNKSIIIPNGGLSTGSINNWSREDYRRVDWMVNISYGDDVEKARHKILEIFASDGRVVEKYVEDDRRERAEKLEEQNPNSVDADTASVDEKTSRMGWLSRFLKRKRVSDEIDDLPTVAALVSEQVERSPKVWVADLADSSVKLKITAWTRSTEYWDVFFDINERIYKELPSAGIRFPFPQLDVHQYPAG
ncbi:MAG: mechanosensitive ion channel [Muribaculaceae bacterium]|nr:mechanosensitive ion channel [Muribaculaceae bacterium]